MNLEDLFYYRRSTRKYQPKQIKEEELQKILDAAQTSPLAVGNDKNTHLTIIQDPDIMAKLRETCQYPSRKHPGKMIDALHGAPTLILVSVGHISDDSIEYCDAACVIENMIIEATNLGLGSCYIWGCLGSLRENKELLAKLNLPDGFTVISGLALGYPVKPLYAREKNDKMSVNYIR